MMGPPPSPSLLHRPDEPGLHPGNAGCRRDPYNPRYALYQLATLGHSIHFSIKVRTSSTMLVPRKAQAALNLTCNSASSSIVSRAGLAFGAAGAPSPAP